MCERGSDSGLKLSRELVEIDPNLTLDQVQPISKTAKQITDREMLVLVAELPVLNACLILYDKNIKTVLSSANAGHILSPPENSFVGRDAFVTVDYGSLSNENRAIAQEVCAISGNIDDPNDYVLAGILIPISEDLNVAKLSDKLLSLAKKFKPQTMVWAGQSLEELNKSWGMIIGQPGIKFNMTPEDFINKGFFYDEPTGVFFRSKEHLEKEQSFSQGTLI